MQSPARHSSVRRGSGTTAAVCAIAGLATVTAASVMVGPRILFARDGSPTSLEAVEPRTPEHASVLAGLADIIGGAAEVIAIHRRGATPYDEIVLWAADTTDPGTINRSEVLVISHSRILRTITAYRCEPPPESSLPEIAGVDTPAPREPRDPGLQRQEVVRPDFCSRFRSHPHTAAGIIARDVSDLSFEPVRSEGDRRTVLRITIKWSDESVNGPDSGTALVDARLRQGTNQEKFP